MGSCVWEACLGARASSPTVPIKTRPPSSPRGKRHQQHGPRASPRPWHLRRARLAASPQPPPPGRAPCCPAHRPVTAQRLACAAHGKGWALSSRFVPQCKPSRPRGRFCCSYYWSVTCRRNSCSSIIMAPLEPCFGMEKKMCFLTCLHTWGVDDGFTAGRIISTARPELDAPLSECGISDCPMHGDGPVVSGGRHSGLADSFCACPWLFAGTCRCSSVSAHCSGAPPRPRLPRWASATALPHWGARTIQGAWKYLSYNGGAPFVCSL